jgi:hypothetical protein
VRARARARLVLLDVEVVRGVRLAVLVGVGALLTEVFEDEVVRVDAAGFFVVWADADRAVAPMSSVAVPPTTDR